MKKSILFILLLVYTSLSFAQTKTLSLKECIAIGLQQNFDIQSNQLSNSLIENNVLQQHRNRYPTVSTSFSHGANFGRTIDPTTNAFNATQFQSGSLGLSINATVYNGNLIKKTIEKYSLDKEVNELQLEELKYNFQVQVIDVYFAALTAKRTIRLSEFAKSQTNKLLSNVTNQFNVGQAKKSDLLLLQLQQTKNEEQLLAAQNAYAFALFNIKTLINLPLTDAIEIQESGINSEQNAITNLQGLTEQVTNNHPGILGFQKELEVLDQSKEMAKTKNIPRISIGGNVGTNYSSLSSQVITGSAITTTVPTSLFTETGEAILQNSTSFNFEDTPFFTQINNNFSQGLYLSLSLPIYSRSEVKKELDDISINQQQKEIQQLRKANELEEEVAKLFLEQSQSQLIIEKKHEQLKKMEELMEQYIREFGVGSLSVKELTDLQDQMQNLNLSISLDELNYTLATNKLNFYSTGQLLND